MTKQADFKRRVRARMAKTGESYAAARAQLLAIQDLICIGEYLGAAHFGGLGELQPTQLHGLLASAAAPLGAAAVELAARAWAALRAPDPAGLGAIAATPSRELRFVAEGFDRLSREYPSTRDGLSLTERRILAATGGGWVDAGAVFGRIGAQSGIDRWIGGVRLAGDDARWRWDEGTEAII
jgi:hypothetical protein